MVKAYVSPQSYVLCQERNVLSSAKPAPAPRVRKNTISRPTQQPLVNVAPANVFEPGSLLHKT